MPIYMSMLQATLNDDSSYDTWANFQVGSNGDTSGDPTYAIGDLFGAENWCYNTWDSNLNGGFDTSNVPVSFDVTSQGNEVLTVGSDAPLTYQTGDIGPITSVVLEAAVQTNAIASWSSVSVEFLQNGSPIEVDSCAGGPQVNTVNSGGANVQDQIMTIVPTAANADEVKVTGIMRMRSPGINYPSGQGMFCNIFVNGANATAGGGGTGVDIGGNNGSGG